MPFQLSPGVNVSEIDLTTVIPSVATSIGAFCGEFNWGPANEVTLITDENRLVERFGKPDNNNFEDWFSVANFLSYTNNLKLVRAINSNNTLTTATTNATNVAPDDSDVAQNLEKIIVENDDAFIQKLSSIEGDENLGQITSYTVVSSGTGLLSNASITITGANTSQAVANVTYKVASTQITNAGTGYATGNTFSVRTGSNTSTALLTVSAVDANGNITSVVITTAGSYISPNNLDSAENYDFPANTASGTGFTANVYFGINSVVPYNGQYGSNYSPDDAAVSITGTGLTGAAVTPNLTYTEIKKYFIAKYPGELGNSLKVSICSSPTAWNTWAQKDVIKIAPGTSDFASNIGASNDEIHLLVIDENGKFSGTKDVVLEQYSFLSKASNAKTADGSSNYYFDVINNVSKYIRCVNHPENASAAWGTEASNGVNFADNQNVPVYYSFSYGNNGTVSTGNIIDGYDKFANADEVDISLLISGSAGQTIVTHLIDEIAENRKDCVVFVSPPKEDVLNNFGDESADCIAYRDSLTSSSYAVFDSNWKYQFDKYNNAYRWIPMNADIAGLCARTDNQRDPWFSPAGYNRGVIKNVIKVAWNPNKSERDDLYVNGINPVVTFPGEGTILFGDKTMQSKPSAFDRINVRRLFIVLEKAVARASKFSLFEFNDQFTRAQFVALVEPFLRDVKGRRGIYDFRVVCDETNNTGEVIDRNEFIGDIYIKPARSINFIQLNFVAVRTGVNFEEIVGKF